MKKLPGYVHVECELSDTFAMKYSRGWRFYVPDPRGAFSKRNLNLEPI
jgi:hypothetical protein